MLSVQLQYTIIGISHYEIRALISNFEVEGLQICFDPYLSFLASLHNCQ